MTTNSAVFCSITDVGGGVQPAASMCEYDLMVTQQQMLIDYQLELKKAQRAQLLQQRYDEQQHESVANATPLLPSQPDAPVCAEQVVAKSADLHKYICRPSPTSPAEHQQHRSSTKAQVHPTVVRQLCDLTVTQLKCECKRRSMPVGGPKPHLLQRLTQFEAEIIAERQQCTYAHTGQQQEAVDAPVVQPATPATPSTNHRACTATYTSPKSIGSGSSSGVLSDYGGASPTDEQAHPVYLPMQQPPAPLPYVPQPQMKMPLVVEQTPCTIHECMLKYQQNKITQLLRELHTSTQQLQHQQQIILAARSVQQQQFTSTVDGRTVNGRAAESIEDKKQIAAEKWLSQIDTNHLQQFHVQQCVQYKVQQEQLQTQISTHNNLLRTHKMIYNQMTSPSPPPPPTTTIQRCCRLVIDAIHSNPESAIALAHALQQPNKQHHNINAYVPRPAGHTAVQPLRSHEGSDEDYDHLPVAPMQTHLPHPPPASPRKRPLQTSIEELAYNEDRESICEKIEISPTNNVANTKSATAAPSDAAMQEVFAAVINRAKQEEENLILASITAARCDSRDSNVTLEYAATLDDHQRDTRRRLLSVSSETFETTNIEQQQMNVFTTHDRHEQQQTTSERNQQHSIGMNDDIDTILRSLQQSSAAFDDIQTGEPRSGDKYTNTQQQNIVDWLDLIQPSFGTCTPAHVNTLDSCSIVTSTINQYTNPNTYEPDVQQHVMNPVLAQQQHNNSDMLTNGLFF